MKDNLKIKLFRKGKFVSTHTDDDKKTYIMLYCETYDNEFNKWRDDAYVISLETLDKAMKKSYDLRDYSCHTLLDGKSFEHELVILHDTKSMLPSEAFLWNEIVDVVGIID